MDSTDSMDAGEINNFRQTEFLFYLLPCYYGVIALLYRYFSLIEVEPTYYVTHIPGQRLLKNIQSEQEKNRNSQALTYRVLPASYVIKSKLCLFNCYLYIGMVLLSFICTPAMFYSAKHKLHCFLYLFGALAWYMSALVLRREQQRNMGQSIWIHRLFWILAGTFSVYKMFEDYFLPINLILNICLIISNIILAIYGIYRAEDSDTLLMVVSEDIPGFVKVFFQMLELNDRIRYWMGIEDQINENLADDLTITKPQINNQDLQEIGGVFKHSAEHIKTQINLLNQLPRRNVFVDRKVRYMKVGDKFKSCYFILTQIGNSRFETQRTLEEFQTLYSIMSEIFKPQNFPKHKLPPALGLLSGVSEGNLCDSLQSWFQQVLKTPIFIIKQVLQFLNVDQQKSAPFLTYFQNSFSTFCSRHYMLIRHNKLKQQQNNDRQTRRTETLVGYFDPEIKKHQPTDNEKILELLKYQIQFTVGAENVIGEDQSVKFNITSLIERKKRLYWDLKKTEISLGLLNQKVEEQCNCAVPFYYTLVGCLNTRRKKTLIENCRLYLEKLLNNKKYYCTSLFTFIKFDFIKREVNTSGALLTFEIINERKSRYMEQYDDKGAFIEVLRIDRIEPTGKGQDLFKFKVKRKDIVLYNKTTEQLKQLKTALSSLYKGVSFVPELKLKNSSKLDVKLAIENFLLRIQNLPKIQIVSAYRQFYGNSGAKE